MQLVIVDGASVTNGSSSVVMDDGIDLSGVIPHGALFKIQGSAVVYKVANVQGQTLTLNNPYGEDTDPQADVVIQLTVTPNKKLPILQSGAIDANELISYGFSLLD